MILVSCTRFFTQSVVHVLHRPECKLQRKRVRRLFSGEHVFAFLSFFHFAQFRLRGWQYYSPHEDKVFRLTRRLKQLPIPTASNAGFSYNLLIVSRHNLQSSLPAAVFAIDCRTDGTTIAWVRMLIPLR